MSLNRIATKDTSIIYSAVAHLPSPTQISHKNHKRTRRSFNAQEKLKLLEEASLCTKRGELTAFLRKNGLFSSHLATWRKQREQGLLKALDPQKPGPSREKKVSRRLFLLRIAELENRMKNLNERIAELESIIQKK